ncbi:MAG: 2,3-dimethylmalate lyase [Alphaproteobacteria bacterium MarineAlpha2_Bin1]|nr:MAG: 2,3-dimethylmalate lyase [Alphaproteobacteria bacterium MarineAlpha2_Bin1]
MALEILVGKDINKKLKTIIERRNATIVPGAFNAITAKQIQDANFEAVYLTGAGITNAQLGLPDLGFINVNNLLDIVNSVRDICELPIIVDIDTGFGNEINLYRTIRALERSGVSGVQIEDQEFPKKCGHFEEKKIISINEAINKIKAAVDSRIDNNFCIIARTDARAVLGFNAAIDRAGAFLNAGADVIFIESPTTKEEILKIPNLIKAPHMINLVHGGKTPVLEKKELEQMGYSIVLYANALLQAAMLSSYEILNYINKNGSISGYENKLVSFNERQKILNKDFFDNFEKKYSLNGDK